MTRILFGLGNPGARYASTRHNAGWRVLDRLAQAEGAAFRPSRFLDGEEAACRMGEEVVRLVRSTTFMNLCGPAYARALEVWEAEAQDALVVSDDFMLPFGRMRFRADGSAGGHNGLRSIEDALGSAVYPRLKLGIGPVPAPLDPAVYVLQPFDPEQRKALPALLERGEAACRSWLAEGLEAASNRFNAGA